MRKIVYISIFTLLPLLSFGQVELGNPDQSHTRYTLKEFDNEEMLHLELSDIFIFPNNRRGRVLFNRYSRLINAIRVTYPVANAAKQKLVEMEEKIATMDNKERKKYVKSVEDELKKEYTPVLKKMSMYQGVILLKLIDRLTGDTSYGLVKELRGSFSAIFWQGVARIFGANLKLEYDPETEDALLEELIIMYERGMI